MMSSRYSDPYGDALGQIFTNIVYRLSQPSCCKSPDGTYMGEIILSICPVCGVLYNKDTKEWFRLKKIKNRK